MHTPQLADNLRRALLQAAIEGKLSERQADDGHAQDLLKQIQAEKAARIQAGRLKKSKGLPEIGEDEKPFAIPENWVWVRLGEIADVSAGLTPNQKDLSSKGEIPYFKVSDMNSPENSKYMVKAESFLAADAKYKTVPANSIIYPKNGGALLTNKRRITTKECLIDLNTGYCTPINVNLDYIYFWFSSINFSDFYTGTAVPTVNAGKIKELLFPLPPLAEQARIVAKLDALLAETDALKAQETALADAQKNFPKMLRASLLQAAIEGKLTERQADDGHAQELLKQIQAEKAALVKAGRLKKSKGLPEIGEDEKPFEIPENWVWVRLGEIFSMQAGKFIKADDISETGEYPCFGGNGMRGYTNTYNREGYFPLIGRQGALCGNIKIANGKFYATEHAVVVETFADCNPLWAGHFLTALDLNQYATSTAQPGLSVEKISVILIPLPPLAEQVRIVAKLDALLAQIESLENLS
ncbi:TPA: restriction endonuclease subunit S [Neisseria weaveri]